MQGRLNRSDSQDSIVTETNLLSSFQETLFSTSPCVFTDIYLTLETLESEQEYIKNIKNNFTLVLKDIIIFGLQKLVKKYYFGYFCYQSLIESNPIKNKITSPTYINLHSKKLKKDNSG